MHGRLKVDPSSDLWALISNRTGIPYLRKLAPSPDDRGGRRETGGING
jgi:hypothetical protein